MAADTMLEADSFGRGVVATSHKAVGRRTLVEIRKRVEDGAVAIVQQQDAQVKAWHKRIPQRILVVKETEVADNAEDKR